MVIKVYVSIINSKTRMNQELKSEGQGYKSIFPKMEKIGNFSYFGAIFFFKSIAEDDQNLSNMFIENIYC